MRKLIVRGGSKLSGEVKISGAKNVALKAIVAACLTQDKVIIRNIPLISDVLTMLDLVREIGGQVELDDHTATIHVAEVKTHKIPLEAGAKIRASTLFLAPLLARSQEAIIPNPGGCRIGARPIDRIVRALEQMNANVTYHSEDGYFHAKVEGKMQGTIYRFSKKSHTGTETLILAAVLAEGKTIIENAALEPEVDSLIELLEKMGAKVKRVDKDTIEVEGVESLHGAEFTLPQDRNEVVTFAAISVLTGGEIWIRDVNFSYIEAFMEECDKAGIKVETVNGLSRFYAENDILPTNITTNAHPGFMTDWQGVWAVLMTQADGKSTIHETIYENRFGYKEELEKMGAKIKFVETGDIHPEEVYSFNYEGDKKYNQKVEIEGKTPLHNAVLTMSDLRAGATLVLASLIAKGTSVIYGADMVERGYEDFDKRLTLLGAKIKSEEETI